MRRWRAKHHPPARRGPLVRRESARSSKVVTQAGFAVDENRAHLLDALRCSVGADVGSPTLQPDGARIVRRQRDDRHTMTVVIDGRSLSRSELDRVARHGEAVELSPAARKRVRAHRQVAAEAFAGGERVYGLTTGVGAHKRTRLKASGTARFNRDLILNCRVGSGPLAPVDLVRATMLRLVNLFARGPSGVRVELVDLIVAALNQGDHPEMRIRGSIGQADLPPLADLAYGVLADKEFDLAPGEGLALCDNNAFSTALAALATSDCERLLNTLEVAGAVELEAFGANLDMLNEVTEQRPFPGLITTLQRLRMLLAGSALWGWGAARDLQDPLSFRCLPQIHGAGRDAFDYLARQLSIELNAVQGNPLVALDQRRVVSGGSFEILPLATALDLMRIALAPMLTCANERMIKLLQPAFSGLREGLATGPDSADDGYNEFAVAGQAITAEARLLAQPVSFELVSSTSAQGIEDRTTMAPLAARRLSEMVQLGEELVAIEFAVATRTLAIRSPTSLGGGCQRAVEAVLGQVSPPSPGNPVPHDLEPLRALVRSGGLESFVAAAK